MTNFEKQTISYVPFSDETKDFLLISLINYSEKSFAFGINYLNNLTKDKLNKEQKQHMEYVKDFFGKSEDPEIDSLNGMGNTKLTDESGTPFFGYVFSKASGQKALKWFASRAAELPTKEKLGKKKLPSGMERDTTEYQNYLNDYSYKSEKELFEMLDVSETKSATKYTKKPVYTTEGPKFEASKTKALSPKALIKGLPTSTKLKKPTLQEAIETILDMIEEGEIDENFVFEKEYDAKDEEEVRVGYVTMKDMKTIRNEFKEKHKASAIANLGSLKFEIIIKNLDD